MFIIIIISGSGSGKTNALINLINEQNDIDKIYLYARDLSEPKYEYVINKCSNTMDNVYKNINDYNPIRIRKKLFLMIWLQAIIKELFIRCRKLNIPLVFITQSYLPVPKDTRLNTTHYFIMKISNRIELKNIAADHSADIDYEDFKKNLQRMHKRTV